MQSKIETIRKACIEANPEIVALKFGCEFVYKKDEYRVTSSMSSGEFSAQNMNFACKKIKDFVLEQRKQIRIIGRRIRLADVMYAIQMPNGSWIKTTQWFCFYEADTDNELVKWDLLKDDLTQQSEETIEFIYNLLK